MSNIEVLKLQERLNEVGYGPVEMDGQYGKETEQAYRSYLASLDGNTPTLIPKPEKKWWHSKAAVGSVSTIIASALAITGISIEASYISELLLATITLVTGITALFGTITRDSAIEKKMLPSKQKEKNVKNKDPRGMFSGDY